VQKSVGRTTGVYLGFLVLAACVVMLGHVIAPHKAGAASLSVRRASARAAEAARAKANDAGASGYQLAHKFKLGGEGGWDYLLFDSKMDRLFISRGTRVLVVNPETGKVIGEIPGFTRSHGIALAPEFNKGFASDGDPGSVTVFDYRTLRVLEHLKTAPDCDGIIYDPGTKRVFTMNGDAQSSTAIDAETAKVLGTFPLGGRPEFAAADGKGHVFANLVDKSEIVKIDAKDLRVVNTWPLAPCKSPSGLAIDAENERLFPGCHSGVMDFVDGDSGKVLETVPIGEGIDAARFDPGTHYAFASCGDGTITVAQEESPDKLSKIDTIKTQRGARTMALNLKTHMIYTVTADFGPMPAAKPGQRFRRPPIIPGTFVLLEYAR
jgi:DNA-binding beta-propeller fold protein YncE